jgi:hypothetical protein
MLPTGDDNRQPGPTTETMIASVCYPANNYLWGASVESEERPERWVIQLSADSAVLVDDHRSWYAVHWKSNLEPSGFLDVCFKDLGIDPFTPTLMLDEKGSQREALDSIRQISYASSPGSIDFLRVDAQDFVLTWESGIEDPHLILEHRDAPYAALVGFGSDQFDPGFGRKVFRMTADNEITSADDFVWQSIDFLASSFKESRIDPHRGYHDG